MTKHNDSQVLSLISSSTSRAGKMKENLGHHSSRCYSKISPTSHTLSKEWEGGTCYHSHLQIQRSPLRDKLHLALPTPWKHLYWVTRWKFNSDRSDKWNYYTLICWKKMTRRGKEQYLLMIWDPSLYISLRWTRGSIFSREIMVGLHWRP